MMGAPLPRTWECYAPHELQSVPTEAAAEWSGSRPCGRERCDDEECSDGAAVHEATTRATSSGGSDSESAEDVAPAIAAAVRDHGEVSPCTGAAYATVPKGRWADECDGDGDSCSGGLVAGDWRHRGNVGMTPRHREKAEAEARAMAEAKAVAKAAATSEAHEATAKAEAAAKAIAEEAKAAKMAKEARQAKTEADAKARAEAKEKAAAETARKKEAEAVA